MQTVSLTDGDWAATVCPHVSSWCTAFWWRGLPVPLACSHTGLVAGCPRLLSPRTLLCLLCGCAPALMINFRSAAVLRVFMGLCSSGPGPTGTCKELCLHNLFVMVKVLRVPASNPLVWQLSLNGA